jgi:hypothetical protein
MSVEQLEQSVLRLSRTERGQFARWFFEHADELTAPDSGDLHPDVQAEILRRRNEADAHADELKPWAGTTDRARTRLHELRHQKSSAC